MSTREPRRRSLQITNEKCHAVLKVLADSNRLRVIEALFEGPKSVGVLGKSLSIEQSLLSHHLSTLKQAGLVEGARRGKEIVYSVSALAGVVAAGRREIDLGCCRLSFH